MMMDSEPVRLPNLFIPTKESITDATIDVPIQQLFDECLNFISIVDMEQ